ncbi:hypothetical protein BH10CHL1_BH10CHL1_32930 [soil metagenome]
MTEPFILTLIDTTSIQNYIFGSNRVRENIGASALVEQATRDWPCAILRETMQLRHNLGEADIPDLTQHIETGQIDAELIYAGGGNTAILFASRPLALDFAGHYSKKLLILAPGLQIALVHIDVQWDDPEGNFRQAWNIAHSQIAIKKATRPFSTPLLGVGVTAACESTDLPATSYDPFFLKYVPNHAERRYRAISSEIAAKLGDSIFKWSRERLEEMLPVIKNPNHPWYLWYDPEQDELNPDDGEGHYLAVVHVDANGMGRRFTEIVSSAADDRNAVSRLGTLSQKMQKAGATSLARLCDWLVSSLEPPTAESQSSKADYAFFGTVNIKFDQVDRPILPFRPLVYGGDDITFICDGRLGLRLARQFVAFFEEEASLALQDQPLPAELKRVYACAGIAIVKLHYPFSRAYTLANELCNNAKSLVREKDPLKRLSALDWHIANSGLYGTLQQTRTREYHTPYGDLYMRPLLTEKHLTDWATWETFTDIVKEFSFSKTWRGKQNKVIQLREALRQGPAAVERYRKMYELDKLPELAIVPSARETGWDNKTCAYFDAIETMDFLLWSTKEREQTEGEKK